jgi:hypothetical protein
VFVRAVVREDPGYEPRECSEDEQDDPTDRGFLVYGIKEVFVSEKVTFGLLASAEYNKQYLKNPLASGPFEIDDSKLETASNDEPFCQGCEYAFFCPVPSSSFLCLNVWIASFYPAATNYCDFIFAMLFSLTPMRIQFTTSRPRPHLQWGSGLKTKLTISSLSFPLQTLRSRKSPTARSC